MIQHVANTWVTQAVYVAAKLGIADQLAEQPQSSESLARRLGTDVGVTFRLLRMLASVGIFCEQEPGLFANTPSSETLRDAVDGSQRATVIAMIELGWRAWGDLLECVKTGEPAFPRVHGKTRYEALDADPALSAMFDRSMAGPAKFHARGVIAAYDFTRYKTIVDVGGGDGTLLAAILASAPAARGVLFERANVVAQAKARLAEFSDRCELVAGDFFVDPIPGGDAIVLKSILHNWNDEQARTLLARCKAALPADGRLIMIEPLIAPGNAPDFHKLVDMHMLVIHGGRERSQDEYQALLASVGLKISSVVMTAPPSIGIVEAQHA